MGVTTTLINKPFSPRGNDQSPLAYNRAKLYSGKALDFDGVNDLITTPNISVQSSNVWTYTFNFYRETGGGSYPYIFDARSSGGDGYTLFFNPSNLFTFYDSESGSGSRNIGPVYEFDKWYSIALISDGTNVSLYVNGVFADSVSGFDSVAVSDSLYIAARYSASDFYTGQMAGFKIFNTALTAAQVADLYNNPEKVVPTGVDNTALKLWLPMMEGAGTTAYDGSGNGNHGTISGATYVNGVGSPVAQSAVMDWNKTSNLLPESNGFVEADSNYVYTNSSETEATITAPDGSTDAFEYICDAVTTNNQFFRINPNTTYTSGQVYTYSLFVKYNTKQFVKLAYMNYAGNNYFVAAFDLINGTITDTDSAGTAANTSSFIEEAPNGWYRIGISAALVSSAGNAMNFEFNVIPSGTPTWSTYGRVNQTTTTSDKVYIYGASLIEGEQGPYVHTEGTAQTSDVLLPQGLTSGRDITGVNLFENVRKQGALNLDGNSWAEVHDNASLDITDAITLEAWVYWDLNGKSAGGIMSKWFPSNWGFLFFTNADTLTFYISNVYPATASVSHTFTANGWYHLVGTDDGTTIRLYIDGVQVGTTSSLGSIVDTGRELEIGRYNDSVSNTYGDSIAQPRIYNRALTAEEVQRNYNAGKNTYTN